jgi:hypothetical protein
MNVFLMQAQPIPKPPAQVEHALIEACVSDELRSTASSHGRAFYVKSTRNGLLWSNDLRGSATV